MSSCGRDDARQYASKKSTTVLLAMIHKVTGRDPCFRGIVGELMDMLRCTRGGRAFVANGQQRMVNGRRGVVVLTSWEALAGLDLCVERVGDEADNIEVGDSLGCTIKASGTCRETAPGGPVLRKFRTTYSRSGCCTMGRQR